MIILNNYQVPKSCQECGFTYVDICPLLKKSVHREVIMATKAVDCPLTDIKCNQCSHYIENNNKMNGTCNYTCSLVTWHGFCDHYVERVNTFIDDQEKLRDFWELTKEEFLQSYSYLTEEEYDTTVKELKQKLEERS